ncbi:MAG: 16S rRNA (cytidine(1402)-2'-O)-methyltransferase [Deltaproteobacteria bacterium]|nr:16S rRNA (cytidine(1402)-2'-O)-methyltransferase [Deltaproteobacteria bacterium]
MNGKLYLVATPLGNLKDITLRALEVLKSVDSIACEDTRHSLKLLQTYEIQKPLFSLHDHNETKRVAPILERLKEGKSLALISDAGTPLISDPGYRLVEAVLAAGFEVEAIPGPCAAINALVGSGLPTDKFYFVGFLPPKSAARRRRFEALLDFPSTLIFYESPHRIQKFLEEAHSVFGSRRLVLAREMTKKFEEFYRGRLQPKPETIPLRSWKGEYVVLLEGANSSDIPST